MKRIAIYGLWALALLLFPSPQPVCAADQYSIKEMTPEVETALQNRRNRFDQLKELKAKGLLGENNQGYVQVLVSDPSAQSVAEAENQDRRTIYSTIAQQNNLTHALATIEGVFAQVQRDKAQAGDKIQLEDGSWVSK